MARDNFAAAMLEKHLVNWDEFFPRPYVYSFPVVSLTGGAPAVQAQSTLNIEQDAPFVITEQGLSLWTANFENLNGANAPLYDPTGTIANISVQVFDSGASNYLSNAPIPLRELMGLAGRDRRELPVPYLVQQNTNLVATFSSADTRAFDIQMVLHGFKIIRRPTPIKNGAEKIMDEWARLSAGQRAGLIRQLR